MQYQKKFQSRRDFMRACLLAGAALAVPRWVSGGRADEASDQLRSVLHAVEPTPVPPIILSSDLNIIPRSKWVAYATRLSLVKPASAFTRLTVHHAGTGVNVHLRQEDVIFDLNGILEAHLQQHYGDIGYHFIVDRAGRIWEGRSLAYEGAHVCGMNDENIGVMLLGNFEEQYPAAEQVSALFMLVEDLREKYDISGESVYGHRDLGQSACPGKHLYIPYLAELKQS